jgi:hypothetical protein
MTSAESHEFVRPESRRYLQFCTKWSWGTGWVRTVQQCPPINFKAQLSNYFERFNFRLPQDCSLRSCTRVPICGTSSYINLNTISYGPLGNGLRSFVMINILGLVFSCFPTFIKSFRGTRNQQILKLTRISDVSTVGPVTGIQPEKVPTVTYLSVS